MERIVFFHHETKCSHRFLKRWCIHVHLCMFIDGVCCIGGGLSATERGGWGAAFTLASKFAPRASLAACVKTARCLIIFSDTDLHGF